MEISIYLIFFYFDVFPSQDGGLECVTVQEGFYLVTISYLAAGCLWFCW